MAFRDFLICASALFIQSICCQVITGPGVGNLGLGWNSLGGLNNIGCSCGSVASTGGGLPITSASPCVPIGISIRSDNDYEGVLSAGGNVPFLGTVAFEGVLPTFGGGAVSYGCGNGGIGMASEGPVPTSILASRDFAINNGICGFDGIGLGLNGVDGLGGMGYGIGGLGYSGIY